jgi:hypothetical protein
MVNKKVFRRCIFDLENILNGVSDKLEPPIESTQSLIAETIRLFYILTMIALGIFNLHSLNRFH